MADGLFYVDHRQPFIAGDVTAVTMAATAKALIPVANMPVLGGNYFSMVGKAMRIRVFGRLTITTTPGNLTMQLNYGSGADANGVVLASTGAVAMTASAAANQSWQVEYLVRCRTLGATGTLFCTGFFEASPALIAGSLQPIIIPPTAPVVSAACDLTASLYLSPQVIQSGTPVGSVQVHDVLYEALNQGGDMARDYITITPTQASVQAGLLKSYISALRQAYNLGVQCAAIMTHNNDGTNFADIEELFGIEAGQGQVVFDLVNGSTGAMVGTFQNTDCKTITEKVG